MCEEYESQDLHPTYGKIMQQREQKKKREKAFYFWKIAAGGKIIKKTDPEYAETKEKWNQLMSKEDPSFQKPSQKKMFWNQACERLGFDPTVFYAPESESGKQIMDLYIKLAYPENEDEKKKRLWKKAIEIAQVDKYCKKNTEGHKKAMSVYEELWANEPKIEQEEVVDIVN